MKLKGTDFQIKVWNEIKKIPKGSVRTYKEIAIAINHPKSYRAVANACKKTLTPLLSHATELLGPMEVSGVIMEKKK